MVTTAPQGAVGVGFARNAEALHQRGDSAEALHLLTAGVRRFPGDVTALLVLARVCQESGRPDEARDWIAAALRLDPGCPAANDPRSLLHPSPSVRGTGGAALSLSKREGIIPTVDTKTLETAITPSPSVNTTRGEASAPHSSAPSALFGVTPIARTRDVAPPVVASTFVFPVREEEEEPELEEDSAPHVATVTLAEIYLQQGLKEQAAQIYRQLLERQPEDDSARRRLNEILREIEAS
jgi:tetratricopeptide (TPR) repeat protein